MVNLINDISTDEENRRYNLRKEYIAELAGISIQDALEELKLIEKHILFDSKVIKPSGVLKPL
jgi:uncharacterized protein YnzC (UPF0291/DUF896 family)